MNIAVMDDAKVTADSRPIIITKNSKNGYGF